MGHGLRVFEFTATYAAVRFAEPAFVGATSQTLDCFEATIHPHTRT